LAQFSLVNTYEVGQQMRTQLRTTTPTPLQSFSQLDRAPADLEYHSCRRGCYHRSKADARLCNEQ
jgi:hypothetical protein